MTGFFEVVRPAASLRVYPADLLTEVVFHGGHKVLGIRPETPDNVAEAADQGYLGPNACWRSLVEHELLHILVAEWMDWPYSLALAHESGFARVPYGERLYEEALVLAFQRYTNTGQIWPALAPWKDQLADWRRIFERARLPLVGAFTAR